MHASPTAAAGPRSRARARHTLIAAIAYAALSGCTDRAPAPYPQFQSQAHQLAASLLLADTHIDVPYQLNKTAYDVSSDAGRGDFDYSRAVRGGLDLAFMSIYVPAENENNGARVLADALIDIVEGIVANAPEKFGIADSVADARELFAMQRVALAMGMENGAPLEGELDALAHFYERGIRYITLTHSKSNHISDSSYDHNRPWGGLSPFGERVVAHMNTLGIMIDVSHVSDEAFFDVIELSNAPVIASHSSVRHFTPGWERNISDEMLQRLADRGGVIQINFGSGFLTQQARAWYEAYTAVRDPYLDEHGFDSDGPEADAFQIAYRREHPYPFATLDDVLDHIDHVRDLVGIDHVGLGSDFDGVGDSLPAGLKDVSGYPNLIAGLLARGYSEADIGKVLSGNLLRVWTEVEELATSPPP